MFPAILGLAVMLSFRRYVRAALKREGGLSISDMLSRRGLIRSHLPIGGARICSRTGRHGHPTRMRVRFVTTTQHSQKFIALVQERGGIAVLRIRRSWHEGRVCHSADTSA